MLESSKDLLLLVIAFCVLWLTLFISWTIYYVAQILRQTNSIIKRITDILEKFDSLLDYFREKLDKTSSYFAIILTAVKQVMDYLGEGKKQAKKRTAKKKK